MVITVTMVIIVIKKMARVITKMVIIMTTSLCKGRGSCRRFSVISLLELDSLVAIASHHCQHHHCHHHHCHHHHHHDSVIIKRYSSSVPHPCIFSTTKKQKDPKTCFVLHFVWNGLDNVQWTCLQLYESNPRGPNLGQKKANVKEQKKLFRGISDPL